MNRVTITIVELIWCHVSQGSKPRTDKATIAGIFADSNAEILTV